MATQVGSLYTSLTLESSSFLSNMKRAATAAEQGAAQIDRAFGIVKGAAAGFVAALSIDAIGSLVSKGLDYASSLGEISQQLGVTARDLQVYRFAATQVGISQDQLDTGLARLTRTIGTGSKAFGELGVSTKDAEGNSRATGEVMRDLAEKLSKIEDPAKRAAYEVELFGKTGQKLDTILTEGAKGIDAYADSAQRLGIVLDDAAIAKADAAADKLTALKNVLSANIAGVVADNASAILDLGNAIGFAAEKALSAVKRIGDYYRGLKEVYKDSSAGFFDRLVALEDKEGTIKRGQRASALEEIFAGNLRANGLPGFDGAKASAPDSAASPAARASRATSRAAKAPADIYKGLSASDVRLGYLDTANDVLGRKDGLSVGLDAALESSLKVKSALEDLKVTAVDLSKIEIINPALSAAGEKFAQDLSSGLGQALVYGQSLGDALVNSIKAAAAQLITSGLLKLLGGALGGIFGGGVGGFLGGIFGGGKAGGGPVKAGYSYDIGELGRERFVAPVDGMIIPADVLRGAGGQSGTVINVDARGATDPALIEAAARRGAQQGIATAAQAYAGANRKSIPKGFG